VGFLSLEAQTPGRARVGARPWERVRMSVNDRNPSGPHKYLSSGAMGRRPRTGIAPLQKAFGAIYELLLPVYSYSDFVRIVALWICFWSDPAAVVLGVFLVVSVVSPTIYEYPENVKKFPGSLCGHVRSA
jgi:hypothetical protein